MTRQSISTGTTANDGTGDNLRDAGVKINANFVELYQKLGGDSNTLSAGLDLTATSIIFEGSINDSFETSLISTNPTADRTVYLPNANGTILLDSATQTLTNKTLTSPIIATIVNTGTLTLPTSTSTLVGRTTTDTLTNKTLTSPIIATIVNSGTLTLPTSTDTLIGRATTDTLTNKTLTSPKINTAINDSNGAAFITLTTTASAVNAITYANAATGNKPTITASGTDTNITLSLSGKGTGSVEASKFAVTSSTITADGAASTSAGFIICNKATALAVTLANGTVTGETKIFTNIGVGVATITASMAGTTVSFALAQYEGCQVIWAGTEWYIIGNQSVLTLA